MFLELDSLHGHGVNGRFRVSCVDDEAASRPMVLDGRNLRLVDRLQLDGRFIAIELFHSDDSMPAI